MVTAGGIPLTEVNPNTYESKIVPGLFLTGEVLDLTGPSGGYNLQLAFSTGHLAGTTIALPSPWRASMAYATSRQASSLRLEITTFAP